MKFRFILLIIIIVLGGTLSCEFEKPTSLQLPARWNSRLIIPLFDQTYELADLISDSSDAEQNPLFADSTGNIHFTLQDSHQATLNFSTSEWNLPAHSLSADTNFANITVDTSGNVSPIQFIIAEKTNFLKPQLISGKIDMSPANRINFQVELSDTLSNPIQLTITCENFKDRISDTLEIVEILLPVGSDSTNFNLSVRADSLVNDGITLLDSLTFSILLNINDSLATPVEELTQELSISIEVSPLTLTSFFGTSYLSEKISARKFEKIPLLENGVDFDSTEIIMVFNNSSHPDIKNQIISIVGRKDGFTDVRKDTTVSLLIDTLKMDISKILSRLPDSLTVFSIPILEQKEYISGGINSIGIDAKYEISAPLSFMFFDEINIISGNPNEIFIKDSLTRSNLCKSQNGVAFDMEVENSMRLPGYIYLIAGNFPLVKFDSAYISNRVDFYWNPTMDSLFHVSDETTLVKFDTLAEIELPKGEWEDVQLINPGYSQQMFYSDSSVVSLLLDTMYIMPAFKLSNPDSIPFSINTNEFFRIKSYLNVLFDPKALTPESPDTSDTTLITG